MPGGIGEIRTDHLSGSLNTDMQAAGDSRAFLRPHRT